VLCLKRGVRDGDPQTPLPAFVKSSGARILETADAILLLFLDLANIQKLETQTQTQEASTFHEDDSLLHYQ
jgi:hypothetical protein